MGLFDLFRSRKETPKRSECLGNQLQPTMFETLNQTQKFAMFTMLASLAAAPANAEKTAMVQKMLFADAAQMGIKQAMMLNYMQTQTKPSTQTVISTLKTITDNNVLEWLIYCGFGIISVNQNEKAHFVFFDWWQQLGYGSEEIGRVVKKIESICDQLMHNNNF